MRLYNAIGIASFPPVLDFFVTFVFVLFSPLAAGASSLLHIFLIAFIFISVIPFIPTAYSVTKGLIDFNVTKKEQRTLFFLIAGGSYLIAAALFFVLGSQIMLYLALSYAIIDFIVMLINLVWKISVHATIAGPITAIAYVFGWQYLILHILTLVVMWSRIKLKVHNALQVMAGAVVSALITFSVFYIFMPL
ncbi:MAG: hypothetical protein HY514_04295 [Candidatus Aenigmarchaeota archaeon]|nr:hypothetical protein [Candidatus Aenigmarchaeota archaeon]